MQINLKQIALRLKNSMNSRGFILGSFFLSVMVGCANQPSMSQVSSIQPVVGVSRRHLLASEAPLTKLPDPNPSGGIDLRKIKTQVWIEPRISDKQMGYLSKCIKVPQGQTLKYFSLVQITSSPSRIVGIRFGYYLAVETTDGHEDNYSLQVMLLNHETCHVGYVSTGIGTNPLATPPNEGPPSDHSDRDYARSTKLAWFKWRLKHIPGERQKIQAYLDSGSPRLADEEYWSFSQLGYRMPKHYQLV